MSNLSARIIIFYTSIPVLVALVITALGSWSEHYWMMLLSTAFATINSISRKLDVKEATFENKKDGNQDVYD